MAMICDLSMNVISMRTTCLSLTILDWLSVSIVSFRNLFKRLCPFVAATLVD